MILEAGLIEIGTAVAKGIVKSRMPGNDVAGEAVSSVLDLFKSQGEGLIEKRKADRLIANIGDRVVESLLPAFERDGASLDEGSRAAVAFAVAKALEAAKISPQVLIDRDLAPRKVVALCLEASPNGAAGFDAVETALYERILFEAGQQIVDVASQLPAFTERTFAAVLRRETQLLETTDRMLAELSKIREQTQPGDPREASARFEEEYRRAVARNLDVLELFGANVSTASRRYCLSVAYVALTVDRKLRRGRRPAESVPEPSDLEPHNPSEFGAGIPAREFSEQHATRDAGDGGTVGVEQCLANTRRLLIRGVAGSGKTTLLQWIAVRSANRGFESPLADWNDTVPFFVRLRHFAEGQLPKPAEFPGLVTQATDAPMPPGWVEQQLRAGRAVVLVDGVDEVSETRQSFVKAWLGDLISAWGNSRFVVSARTHIDDDWLGKEFDSAEAQPMGMPQIREFIRHWHESVRKELYDNEEIGRLGSQSAQLQAAVSSPGPLRKLATNPLLCAMLCALHRERLGHLPKDRIQLYRECIQVLLERREKLRDIDYSQYPNLSLRHQEILLQELAYYLVLNGWTSVASDTAAQRLRTKLAKMEGLPAGAGIDGVMRYFVERSGVVREPVKGRIDFIHRTFQEFFAAQAAVDAHDIGVLIRNAHDPEWREIIILATGLARDSERDELVSGLIRRGDSILGLGRKDRVPLYLLAAASLETAVSIGPSVKADVERRIAKLPAPRSDREVAGWVSAGDLAVPHLLAMLEPGRSLSPRERWLCGRVLALVGDPRPGVGLGADGLPDIVWCDVPAGPFVYGGDDQAYRSGPRTQIGLPAFRIAKYPVTFVQFQAFIDAPDGCANPHWWQGLHADGLAQQAKGPGEQRFKFDNNPRENVSWYDAMAFCRWLSARLGIPVSLPTEQQWEKAARGADGRAYPYGNEFDAAKGNTSESGLRQTNAVGIYPQGASSCGAHDMSGNVWEWTLTEYETGSDTNERSSGRRVLRGGSWSDFRNGARAACRNFNDPGTVAAMSGFGWPPLQKPLNP